jgi:hypothetical protein
MKSDTSILYPFLKGMLLKRHELWFVERIPRHIIENSDVCFERLCDGILLKLVTYIAGDTGKEEIQYRQFPASWWDFFKMQWFPRWALRMFPVKYSKIEVSRITYKVCPHTKILYNENHAIHLNWIASADKQREE